MNERFFAVALVVLLLPGCAAAESANAPGPAAGASVRSAAPPAGGSRLTQSEAGTILAEHNRVRADVGVAPLTWSPGLAAYAQDWADQLAANDCAFAHRKAGSYGENLFMGTEGAYTLADAVTSWEAEKKDYAGGVLTSDNWFPSGHYTQIVWRTTKSVGCASTTCGGNDILVCNYDPAGNILGRKPY